MKTKAPIRSIMGGRIAARLFELKKWPFKDKEFARLCSEANEDKLIELGYYASLEDGEAFLKKLESLKKEVFQSDNLSNR